MHIEPAGCSVMHVVQGSLNSLCACRFFDHFVASPAESMRSWRHRLAQCLAVPFDTAVVRLFCVLQAMLTCSTQHQACHEPEPVMYKRRLLLGTLWCVGRPHMLNSHYMLDCQGPCCKQRSRVTSLTCQTMSLLLFLLLLLLNLHKS